MHRLARHALSPFVFIALAACGGSRDPGPPIDPGPAPSSGSDEADGTPVQASSSGNAILDAHNARRAAHCAPPLAWSDALAGTAQRWADHLAQSGCGLEHSESSYGENLAAGTTGTLSPEDVVEMWYAEREGYSFARGGFSMDTGHFTQVVWAGSTQLGCAMAHCDDLDIWVCNYDPPGNMDGEYQANVHPTSCR